jgi:hypothetical protein
LLGGVRRSAWWSWRKAGTAAEISPPDFLKEVWGYRVVAVVASDGGPEVRLVGIVDAVKAVLVDPGCRVSSKVRQFGGDDLSDLLGVPRCGRRVGRVRLTIGIEDGPGKKSDRSWGL